jgi:hypothetical protein
VIKVFRVTWVMMDLRVFLVLKDLPDQLELKVNKALQVLKAHKVPKANRVHKDLLDLSPDQICRSSSMITTQQPAMQLSFIIKQTSM